MRGEWWAVIVLVDAVHNPGFPAFDGVGNDFTGYAIRSDTEDGAYEVALKQATDEYEKNVSIYHCIVTGDGVTVNAEIIPC